jgi:excisionase family DNA binding protein
VAAPEERLLTTEEVAERLQVDEQTVRRWIKSGKLEAFKPGREWRISPAAFEALLENYSSPKVTGPAQLELEEQGGAGEERRVERLRPWRILVSRLADRWGEQIEIFDEKGEAPHIFWAQEIQFTSFNIQDALDEGGISDELGEVVDAIEAGEKVSENLRREAVPLWNGLVMIWTNAVPGAMARATHLEDRAQFANQLYKPGAPEAKVEEWSKQYDSTLEVE